MTKSVITVYSSYIYFFQICVNDDLVAKRFAHYDSQSADGSWLDEAEQTPIMLSHSVLTQMACKTAKRKTGRTHLPPGKHTHTHTRTHTHSLVLWVKGKKVCLWCHKAWSPSEKVIRHRPPLHLRSVVVIMLLIIFTDRFFSCCQPLTPPPLLQSQNCELETSEEGSQSERSSDSACALRWDCQIQPSPCWAVSFVIEPSVVWCPVTPRRRRLQLWLKISTCTGESPNFVPQQSTSHVTFLYFLWCRFPTSENTGGSDRQDAASVSVCKIY